MKQNFTNPILGRWIWTAVAIIILATVGHLVLNHELPKPTTQTSSVPTPQTDWRGVDRAVVVALTAAHKSAEITASTRLDSWIRCLMQRADSDFLPWYFGYWNLQALGLKTVCYWAAHELGFSQQAAGERITSEIQMQFARRVLRPEIAQLELETIARDSLQAYVNELGPRLASIPGEYHIPQPDWARYLDDIAVLTSRTEGNRQVGLTLKALTASSVVGSALLVRTLGPHLESVAARVSTSLEENMAASRIAVRAAGEALGEILGVVIIAWDVADHFQTKRRELPVLRTSIADYLAQVRHRLLHDPQSGIITLLDTMEMSIAESQQTRQSSPR